MILTDESGRPIEKPEVPTSPATTEQTIKYLHALHAYNDQVAKVAVGAFNRKLRTSLRKKQLAEFRSAFEASL
jgi:hypothetical protein